MTDEKQHAAVEANLTREEWLERRAPGVGSSDAAVILGVSPYKSALELYHEKRGQRVPHRGELEALRWGNILERPIGTRYAEETRRIVEFPSDPDRYTILRNLERPWQHASLDAKVVGVELGEDAKPMPAPGHGVLEIKNASSYVGERWKEEPPIEFIVQLQHQLAVTGAEWGSLAALIGGVLFVWQDIARDQDFIDVLVKLELEFIGRVEAGDPPPPDGSENARAFLAQLYPKDIGTRVSLGVEFIDQAERWAHANAQIKHWKAERTAAANLITAAIGDATLGALPNGGSFTWKAQTRREHTVKESTFRVLRYQAPKLPRVIGNGPGAALELPEVANVGGDDDE